MLMKDKVAVITGSAGGIGAATALKFAQEGAKAIYIIDMDEKKAEGTVAKIKEYCECHFIKTNVTKEEEVKAVYDHVMATYGKLDALVCCAGIVGLDNIYEMTMKSWSLIMDVNLTGTLLFARDAMKIMKPQGYGTIICLSSISGFVGGIRTNPAYACSKAGITALIKSLAKDGAALKVRVNGIAPGLVATDMTSQPGFKYSTDEVPLGEVACAEDIANAALFLSSDMSRHITGQCLHVNGGMLMN